ncbi:N-terminal nucleophile aminohydrolases (Ntn hydrolases) protein [Dioscorea alata]|uniref:N-terminal nucleophile aminohydrolases (Ntn hydrolases) protein n=1 Tax=Dioscorea alata TaxID=55571 RepID=A0ACB7VX71_DIOAL|nr:N-terminal nucleophile aminohydrolases (Ntn hydrolases) protein [Dioscorea alata]
MLGVFSGEVVEAPEELLAAGSRTPSPKTRAGELVDRFIKKEHAAMSLRVGSRAQLAFSHSHQSPLRPRLFGMKDDICCMFEGVLDNLGRLRQHYGLTKNTDEVLLVIEAYKALRDRAPYTPSSMLAHLTGSFAFIVFDMATSTLLVSCDPDGKVPLYWGITADGFVAFADDLDLLKGSCGKSLAPFPQGCFYSNSLGGLKCYENPKNKITAIPANEEEICGATFQVEGPPVLAARH